PGLHQAASSGAGGRVAIAKVSGAHARRAPLTPALSPLGRGRPAHTAALACLRRDGAGRPLLPRGKGARRADAGASRTECSLSRSLLQLLDEQVRDLQRVAVVLKPDRAPGGEAGELFLVDDALAIQDHVQTVALEGDDEPVPLAGGAVGLDL